jgi:translation initiation factor 2 beta subunit (eIF-2beta)/eIF-5
VKIYIHHPYQEHLLYTIGHNTIDRQYFIDSDEGNIICKYRNVDIEFVFKKEITFEDDGYHILDYFTSFFYGDSDPKIGHILPDRDYMEREVQQVFKIFINLLKDCPTNQKWIITYLRTEKILQTSDVNYIDNNWIEIESLIDKLKNHHIITDNIFLNDSIKSLYPNFYYVLTNTIFQWNHNWGIRWYYEFKQVYDRLHFDYDLMYSIKNHKINRVNIINELSKLNNDKLFLQHSDALKNPDYIEHSQKISHIKTNSIYGNTDFDDISYIPNHSGYMDVFFRVLPKAKMQILCESWSWGATEFMSQYLSEKTFGLLLSGIPFISTHNYPLLIVEKMLDVPSHPFYEESKKCRSNGKLFAQFVDKFLVNFDENYKLCKEWSDLVHSKIMYKIENENSLLDIIIDKELKTDFTIKKSLI